MKFQWDPPVPRCICLTGVKVGRGFARASYIGLGFAPLCRLLALTERLPKLAKRLSASETVGAAVASWPSCAAAIGRPGRDCLRTGLYVGHARRYTSCVRLGRAYRSPHD